MQMHGSTLGKKRGKEEPNGEGTGGVHIYKGPGCRLGGEGSSRNGKGTEVGEGAEGRVHIILKSTEHHGLKNNCIKIYVY